MSRRNRSLIEALSIRLALAQQSRGRRGGASKRATRTAAAIFAAALSVGGVSEVLQSAPFSVRKDLEGVRLVRLEGAQEKVVANVSDSFAANSLYKFARLMPDRYVQQELRLFRAEWLTEERKAEQVHDQISLFNDTVRKEFFSAKIPFGELIHEKAAKYEVDPALVAAVMEQESRFKTRAKSPKGATGLMQLMPRTGAWMGAKNLYDPEQNIDAGVKYLKYLEKRFDGNLTQTVAAYNAGEGTVRRYGGKVPPYRETKTYVRKVMGNYERRQKELKKFKEETLFIDSARKEVR